VLTVTLSTGSAFAPDMLLLGAPSLSSGAGKMFYDDIAVYEKPLPSPELPALAVASVIAAASFFILFRRGKTINA
jgi:hypothetical protein